MFIDPARGDFRVREESPSRELGFENFPMDRFGVQNPALKALARTPRLPEVRTAAVSKRDGEAIPWLGARIKTLSTEGEQSATGMHAVTGIYIVNAPPGSKAAQIGFQANDVIIAFKGNVDNVQTFLARFRKRKPGERLTATIWRDQREQTVSWTAE
jgi:S1-C subfamily serine protease